MHVVSNVGSRVRSVPRLPRMLAVDPSDLRVPIAKMLEGTADVEEARDAEAALALLRKRTKRPIDVAIVDGRLTLAAGGHVRASLVAAIHAEHPGLPIIAVGGADDDHSVVLA